MNEISAAPRSGGRRRLLGGPSTRPGRWSLLLLAVALALFLLANIAVATGQEGGETVLDNPWISIPMVGAGVAVLTAGGFAGFAIIRRRERSLPVFGPLVLGLLVLVFLVGEVTTPH